MQSTLHNPQATRRYLATLGTGVAVIVAAMISLNALVDPYGVYWGNSRSVYSRISLAEGLKRQSIDTVIFGTSRAGAFKPGSPHLGGRTTVNAALGGASLSEIEAVVRFAIENADVKRAIVLIDFFQFNTRSSGPSEIDRSLFNRDLTFVEYHFDKLLGAAATETSTDKLWQSWKDRGAEKTALPAPAAMPRSRFEANARHYLKSPMMFHGFRYSAVELEKFRETVRFAHSRNVELHIAINPIHVMQLETIRAAGLWETFEGWKRDIAEIVAEENEKSGQCSPLWDFTGYASYPAEAMPAAGCATPGIYYNEGSHFTPALAEIMLARMLGGEPCDETFGVQLHAHNIQNHLARIREDHGRWQDDNTADISWIQAIAKEYGHTPPPAILSGRDRVIRK